MPCYYSDMSKRDKQIKCRNCGHVDSRHDFDGSCLAGIGKNKMEKCECAEFRVKLKKAKK